MTLGDLIRELERMPPDGIVSKGFGSPDSYRGFYEDLAFEPAENVTVSSMLQNAKSALGKTFSGYKGGIYTMNEFTDCWISEYGYSSGDGISSQLIWYWQQESEKRRNSEVLR